MDDQRERLDTEILRTRTEYREAVQHFQQLVNQVPSGTPHPDGSVRLHRAGQEVQRTLEEYTKAVQRKNAFVVNRAISPDTED
jgi:hypothetical protein